MYDVSEYLYLIFMCALFFLLWCSIAFYNLKVYVMQNVGRGGRKPENMQKIVPVFITMLYYCF